MGSNQPLHAVLQAALWGMLMPGHWQTALHPTRPLLGWSCQVRIRRALPACLAGLTSPHLDAAILLSQRAKGMSSCKPSQALQHLVTEAGVPALHPVALHPCGADIVCRGPAQPVCCDWQECSDCCLQQADGKLTADCTAPAGNLIGAAGAQALLQAVHSSTGRLTALDLSGEPAAFAAAGSCAAGTRQSCGTPVNRLGPWLPAPGCAAAGRLAIQHVGLPGSRCLHRCCL